MTSFGDERPSAKAARHEVVQAERMAAEEAAVPQAPPPREYPSEEELDAIQEEARVAGYDAGHAAGHADGYREAHAEALAEGKAAADIELEHLRAVVAEFGHAITRADDLIATEVLDLALQLAKGMLKAALPVRPELVLPVVREAIEYLPVLQQPALLMLNPEDAAVVRAGIAEELDKGGWRVVEDPSIERGGCRIDTASNQIDAQTSSRWHRLTQALGRDIEWLQP